MDPDAVREALRGTDTRDERLLYLAWNAVAPRWNGSEVVPLVAEAFARTENPRARESQLHHATLFARFDDAAVELGLRGLADPRKEVRARACMLLAHSRRPAVVPALRAVKPGPTRELAKRAATSLLEGTPLGPGDDPLYFFFRGESGRAPRGTFADDLDREVGPWMGKKGFTVKHLFAHHLAYRREGLWVEARWDSYDVTTQVGLTPRPTGKEESVADGPGDIVEIGRRIRMLFP